MNILFTIEENFNLATHQYPGLRSSHVTHALNTVRNTMCLLPEHRGFHFSAGLHLAK